MSQNGERDSRASGLAAATRRFPAHAFEIEQMVASDEDFRSICDDLGAAESALLSVARLPENLRAERRVECESWIDGLTREIEGALRRKKVIALGAKRSKPPGT